jgi:hypothetical protein
MKFIIIFSCLLILVSCKPSKVFVSENQINTSLEVSDEPVEKQKGKVRESDDCPPMIETYEDGKLVILYPVNLADSLKHNGVKLLFTYTLSKAQHPLNCKLDKTVALDFVKQLD